MSKSFRLSATFVHTSTVDNFGLIGPFPAGSVLESIGFVGVTTGGSAWYLALTAAAAVLGTTVPSSFAEVTEGNTLLCPAGITVPIHNNGGGGGAAYIPCYFESDEPYMIAFGMSDPSSLDSCLGYVCGVISMPEGVATQRDAKPKGIESKTSAKPKGLGRLNVTAREPRGRLSPAKYPAAPPTPSW